MVSIDVFFCSEFKKNTSLENSVPKPPESGSDIISHIQGMIKWYILLGVGSILCFFVGFSLWV